MIGSISNVIGGSIGILVAPFFVTGTNKSQFVRMILFESSLSIACSVLILVFMRNRPPTPSSPSGAVKREPFLSSIKSIMTNSSFIMILAVVSLSLGTFNVFYTVVELLIIPYGLTPVRFT